MVQRDYSLFKPNNLRNIYIDSASYSCIIEIYVDIKRSLTTFADFPQAGIFRRIFSICHKHRKHRRKEQRSCCGTGGRSAPFLHVNELKRRVRAA